MRIKEYTLHRLHIDFDDVEDAGGLHKYCDDKGYTLNDEGPASIEIDVFDSEEEAKTFYDEIKQFLKSGK